MLPPAAGGARGKASERECQNGKRLPGYPKSEARRGEEEATPTLGTRPHLERGAARSASTSRAVRAPRRGRRRITIRASRAGVRRGRGQRRRRHRVSAAGGLRVKTRGPRRPPPSTLSSCSAHASRANGSSTLAS